MDVTIRQTDLPRPFSRWVQPRIIPDGAPIELPRRARVAVTPERLEGAEGGRAWQRITAAQPRYGKYQRKTVRGYPIVRLASR